MFSYHKIYSLFYLCIKRGHSFMQSFISQACIALLQSGYSVPILGVQECEVHCPCPHESYTLAMELNKESGKQKVILCVCVLHQKSKALGEQNFAKAKPTESVTFGLLISSVVVQGGTKRMSRSQADKDCLEECFRQKNNCMVMFKEKKEIFLVQYSMNFL